MSDFDDETRLRPDGEHAFAGHVHPYWNIGDNPNGGYLLALAVAGLRQALPAHPDPLSVTVHFLRPGLSDRPCRVDVQVLRAGRTLSTGRATLSQDGVPRLEVLAAMGELSAGAESTLALPAPEMPPPELCTPRSGAEQGVSLPILDRLDIRLHPDEARAGTAGKAQVTGWIRFHDGRPPDAVASLLFVDAFPPAVFGLLGAIGWVPTIELTVHLRRRPAPGWTLGQFRTHDLIDGRLVEDGILWDADGKLVAQSRQLALVRRGERKS
jgi:acyl-CoA thioesterase